jgi:hypothetical protein
LYILVSLTNNLLSQHCKVSWHGAYNSFTIAEKHAKKGILVAFSGAQSSIEILDQTSATSRIFCGIKLSETRRVTSFKESSIMFLIHSLMSHHYFKLVEEFNVIQYRAPEIHSPRPSKFSSVASNFLVILSAYNK